MSISKKHKRKSAGVKTLLIPHIRLSHCPSIEDKQCRCPRFDYIHKCMYETMDVEHCLTVREIRICEIQSSADKTSVQRLSIMFAASFHGNSVAKLGIIIYIVLLSIRIVNNVIYVGRIKMQQLSVFCSCSSNICVEIRFSLQHHRT